MNWDKIVAMTDEELCRFIAEKLGYTRLERSHVSGLLWGEKDGCLEALANWTEETGPVLLLVLDALQQNPEALQLVIYPGANGNFTVSVDALGFNGVGEIVSRRRGERTDANLELTLARIAALALT